MDRDIVQEVVEGCLLALQRRCCRVAMLRAEIWKGMRFRFGNFY